MLTVLKYTNFTNGGTVMCCEEDLFSVPLPPPPLFFFSLSHILCCIFKLILPVQFVVTLFNIVIRMFSVPPV